MYLPSPTYSFTIPSLHDETQLDCRLYLPRNSSLQSETIRGAIVAHPYAPLGGCYDDPVVSFVGGELLESGYIVGTFNFRGAGTSGGRTSWTAKPELADYVSFYGFMLCYLHSLRSQEVSRRGDGNIPCGANVEGSNPQLTLDRADIHLILGGYSYGSLIASHLPALNVVADLFRNVSAGTQAHGILESAAKVSALLEANNSTQEQNLETGDHLAMEEPLDISGTTISYLLVSPLLPPLNLFLTFFSTMSLDIGAQSPAQRRQIPCPKPTRQLCAHASLVSHMPGGQFQSAEIDGAGHFWRENGVESQAREALGKWLRLIP